jgi:hypothetical protein
MSRHLGPLILLLAASLMACQGPAPGSKPPLVAPKAEQQKQAKLCRQSSQALRAELAALRQAEWQLSRVKQQSQPQLSAPPVWDEAREQRFSEQDQELDRQRYERQLALWQQQQDEGLQTWEYRHRLELAEAQRQLNARARNLRRQHHDLFTGATSIEVNPAVLARIQRCTEAG